MTIQPIPDPNTPIGQIIKAAGSEGIVLEAEGQGRYALLPLDDDVIDLLIEAVQRFATIATRSANGWTLASSRLMRRSGGNWSESDFEEPSHHAKSGRQDSRPQVWACANQLRWKHWRGAREADESIPRPGMVLSSHPSPRRELRTSPSGQRGV